MCPLGGRAFVHLMLQDVMLLRFAAGCSRLQALCGRAGFLHLASVLLPSWAYSAPPPLPSHSSSEMVARSTPYAGTFSAAAHVRPFARILWPCPAARALGTASHFSAMIPQQASRGLLLAAALPLLLLALLLRAVRHATLGAFKPLGTTSCNRSPHTFKVSNMRRGKAPHPKTSRICTMSTRATRVHAL